MQISKLPAYIVKSLLCLFMFVRNAGCISSHSKKEIKDQRGDDEIRYTYDTNVYDRVVQFF